MRLTNAAQPNVDIISSINMLIILFVSNNNIVIAQFNLHSWIFMSHLHTGGFRAPGGELCRPSPVGRQPQAVQHLCLGGLCGDRRSSIPAGWGKVKNIHEINGCSPIRAVLCKLMNIHELDGCSNAERIKSRIYVVVISITMAFLVVLINYMEN